MSTQSNRLQHQQQQRKRQLQRMIQALHPFLSHR